MIINAPTVKDARIAKGWTQQQLADVSGLSLRTVQRVESQGQGSMETCNALCSVLEIERQRLLAPTTAAAPGPRYRLALIICSAVLTGFVGGVAATLVLL